MLKRHLPTTCKDFETGFEKNIGGNLGVTLDGNRGRAKKKIVNFSRGMIFLGMLFPRIGMSMSDSLFMHDHVDDCMGIGHDLKQDCDNEKRQNRSKTPSSFSERIQHTLIAFEAREK